MEQTGGFAFVPIRTVFLDGIVGCRSRALKMRTSPPSHLSAHSILRGNNQQDRMSALCQKQTSLSSKGMSAKEADIIGPGAISRSTSEVILNSLMSDCAFGFCHLGKLLCSLNNHVDAML